MNYADHFRGNAPTIANVPALRAAQVISFLVEKPDSIRAICTLFQKGEPQTIE
jgi:hypothetical protein